MLIIGVLDGAESGNREGGGGLVPVGYLDAERAAAI